MEKFVIQIDTREQEGNNIHLIDYFNKQGIKTVRSKCVVGDYINMFDQTIAVDRKQNIIELINNVTQDHERFRRELILAQELGIKLIILVEEYFSSVYSLQYWKPKIWKYGSKKGQPVSQMRGETLMKILLTMQNKYGVEFRFCRKEETAPLIVKILKEEGKNNA